MQESNRNVIIRELPPSGERPPLFVVGDVHGCASELQALLRKARQRVPDCEIVLVGDLFTKGPEPVAVLELIREYGAHAIKGNHDWALIASIIHAQRRGVETLSEHSRQTLHLIRHHRKAIFAFLSELPHALTTTTVPQRRSWGPSFPTTIVHAGIDPLSGLRETSERMLLTARWVRVEENDGNRRIVAIHSTSRAEMLRHSEPPVPSSHREKHRWHEFHTGPELIIFGHDAKQGLFRKTLPSGRPICVGLDTGCTYGRSLTGYFPEFDDAVQVPSERTYFDSERNVILLREYREHQRHLAEAQ